MFFVCNDAMTHEKKVKNVLLAVRLQYVAGKAPSPNVALFTKSYLLGTKIGSWYLSAFQPHLEERIHLIKPTYRS